MQPAAEARPVAAAGRPPWRRVAGSPAIFYDLPDLLAPGDLLVLNDTRVLPARLLGRRERTGGKWEGLYLGERDGRFGNCSASCAAGWSRVRSSPSSEPEASATVIATVADASGSDGLRLVYPRPFAGPTFSLSTRKVPARPADLARPLRPHSAASVRPQGPRRRQRCGNATRLSMPAKPAPRRRSDRGVALHTARLRPSPGARHRHDDADVARRPSARFQPPAIRRPGQARHAPGMVRPAGGGPPDAVKHLPRAWAGASSRSARRPYARWKSAAAHSSGGNAGTVVGAKPTCSYIRPYRF